MKKFREYINEEMMPYAQTEKGFVGVDNGPVRDNINLLLATVTERPHATPYHALEVIRKVLAPFHIFPPATNFLDGSEGHEIFKINQFGEKVGMTNSGDVVTKDSSPYFLYFEYSMNSRGSFDIFSEVVNQEELDDILDDVEDEMEDDTTTGDGKDAEDSFDVYKSENKLEENYHSSYTSAIQTAVAAAKKRGYEVDQDDYDSKVSSGPRKPSEGKTVSHNLKLTKGGKPTKKGLAIQVYNRGGDKTPYELNHYISEEENLQELSKKTLKSYISKASTRKAQNAADQGRIEVSSNKAGLNLYKQIGKDTKKREKGMALANKKLEEEEKSGMPAWYEKEKAKSLTLQAMTAAKKKQQGKKIKQAIRNMKEASDAEWNQALAARNQSASSAAGKLMAPASGTIQKNVGDISEPRTKADYGGDINMLKKDTSRFDRLGKAASGPDTLAKKPVTNQDRATASQFEEEALDEANKKNKEKKNAAVSKIGFEKMKETGAFHGESPKRVGRAVLTKEEQVNEGYTVLGKYTDSSGNKVGTMHKFDNAKSAEEAKRKAYSKVKRKIGRVSDWKTSRISTNEETINEVGDTPAGKKAVNRVALRGDAEIAYQASKSRPQKKVLKKAMKAVDLAVNTHKRRGNNVLGGYLKHAYGLKEAQSADTHTGALTMNGKPVVSPTATTAQPEFPPKKVPVPKPRPKNLEEANPAREGEIAAGRKGSTPAEQGEYAERKANFKVAKKLARQATKDIIKNKKK